MSSSLTHETFLLFDHHRYVHVWVGIFETSDITFVIDDMHSGKKTPRLALLHQLVGLLSVIPVNIADVAWLAFATRFH